MRRESAEEVAQAAQRRLERLGRELAGVDPGPLEAPAPVVLQDSGRHARRASDPSGRQRRPPLPGAASLRERLSTFLADRVGLSAAQLPMLAVVLVLGVGAAAWWAIRSSPTAVPLPVAQTAAGTALLGPSAGVGTSPGIAGRPGSVAPGTGTVVVDVAGKVRRPGVTTLPRGSRVIDAIRRAGGARPGIDLSTLNLARVLVDGEQILVGTLAPAGVAAGASAGAGPGSSGPLVNLNTAGAAELENLPGVGPVTASKILDWRTAHGSFTAIDELLEVDGIGEKTLARLAPHATL